MSRARWFAPLGLQRGFLLCLILVSGFSAYGQTGSTALPLPSRRPESTNRLAPPRTSILRDQASTKEATARRSVGTVLEALRANALVAPYPIMVSWQGNKVLLSGKVGTKEVYDLTIRTMIDCGIPFRESLIIDTAETYRVAQAATLNAGYRVNHQSPGATSLPYIYPPPLFGRVDDPFFGLEPPAASFPSWWQGRAPNDTGAVARPTDASAATRPSVASRSGPIAPPAADIPTIGKAQISVDEFGAVYLRGVVANEQIKSVLEQEAGSVPGVTQVINELTVENASASSEEPPPPPQPQPPPDAMTIDQKGPKTSRMEAKPLTDRVADALGRRPARAENPVKAVLTGDVVTLSGKVASAYEAMLAFRAAQQTPGVSAVVDQLEFPMPEDDSANPLLQKGEPQDVQAYLENHIRGNLGDAAHVDRVIVRGNRLEIHGTVSRADDKKRLTAILRSIPILRGFEIESSFPLN